ncbi:hypothetical protein CERZMDRAFT_99073 [Cercospora zeae-maydis SCOH1-5]|uniref:Uncharacterized protein n=1 Tax=Cercospora zeae-maydis SCOH1-5 TaxID=717836 RepID=A0A6A6FC11_9PEZI|nr:hypothetical protein CERZMDRAFT_99073 [Cercospora zeae-maydis SCOH1-5]
MTTLQSFLLALTTRLASTTLAAANAIANDHETEPAGAYVDANTPSYAAEVTTVWRMVTTLHSTQKNNGQALAMAYQCGLPGMHEENCSPPATTAAAGPTVVCRCDGSAGWNPTLSTYPSSTASNEHVPSGPHCAVPGQASASDCSKGLPPAGIVQTMQSQSSLQKPDASTTTSCSCSTSYPIYVTPRVESSNTGLDAPTYAPKAPHIEKPRPTLESPQTMTTVVPEVHVEQPAESLAEPGQGSVQSSSSLRTIDATLFSPRTHITQTGLDVPTGSPDGSTTMTTTTTNFGASGGEGHVEQSEQSSATSVAQQTGGADDRRHLSVFYLGAAALMIAGS